MKSLKSFNPAHATGLFLYPENLWFLMFSGLAQIQLLKEVSQTKFQSSPLELFEYHDLPPLSFILSYQNCVISTLDGGAHSPISVENVSHWKDTVP